MRGKTDHREIKGSLSRVTKETYPTLAGALSSKTAAGTLVASTAYGGDLNGDGRVDQEDIQALCLQINSPIPDLSFDLNGDRTLNHGDLETMIQSLLGTDFGDANLDGEFNSSDLVSVFRAGEYEDDIQDNSNWAEGDWNCDGDFDHE